VPLIFRGARQYRIAGKARPGPARQAQTTCRPFYPMAGLLQALKFLQFYKSALTHVARHPVGE
ncbi:MAG: hypothetical protein OXD47_06665, partial [Gammaproteobacteria bacterium]|nr:hypothetical protein [Gammaproteobacteria bacterium]